MEEWLRTHLGSISSRRLALSVSAITSAVAAAAIVSSSITAYRAAFQSRVSINIGTELQLLSSNFGLDKSEITNVAPTVTAVVVNRPVIRVHRQPQSFTIVSAVEKISADLVHPAITFVTPGEADDESEDVSADRNALAALFRPQSAIVVAKKKTIHHRSQFAVVEKTATQPVLPLPAETIQSDIHKEIAPTPFEYSELVTYFNKRQNAAVSQDVAPLVMRGPPVSHAYDVALPEAMVKPLATPEAIHVVRFPDLPKLGPLAADTAVERAGSSAAVSIQSDSAAQTDVATQTAGTLANPIDIRAYMKVQDKVPTQEGAAGPAAVVSSAQISVNASSGQLPSAPAINLFGADAAGPSSIQEQAATPPETSVPPTAPTVKQEMMAMATDMPATPPVPFSGRVVEAFTGAVTSVPSALVQVLGTNLHTTTDDNGAFSFPDVKVSGVLPVIITKDGFLKRRVDLRPHGKTDVELVSENSANLSALAAGDSRGASLGYVFGQLVSLTGEALDGYTVEINGPSLMKSVYADVNGAPSRTLTTTSVRGQFMVVNVPVGTYHVTIYDALGKERAPHIIQVGQHEGLVRKFSLGQQKYLRGRLLNASSASAAIDGATVQLLGSQKTATTNTQGQFILGPVYVDCATLNYIQVDKSGFYRNRVDYACTRDDAAQDYYNFPAGYVDGTAVDAGTPLGAGAGIILGHVGYRDSVKMQLWGPEEMNPDSTGRGKDFYMDADGVLNSTRNRTSTNGNFAILEAPDGLSYMQAFSTDNRTLSFWPIYTSASTVNVYVQ